MVMVAVVVAVAVAAVGVAAAAVVAVVVTAKAAVMTRMHAIISTSLPCKPELQWVRTAKHHHQKSTTKQKEGR